MITVPAVANKAQPTDASVAAFVAGVAGQRRRADSQRGKGCVYVKRLSDVDDQALADLIRGGAAYTRAQDVAP